jgi:hypothetical protein
VHTIYSCDDRAPVRSEAAATRLHAELKIVAESNGGIQLRPHSIEADALNGHRGSMPLPHASGSCPVRRCTSVVS